MTPLLLFSLPWGYLIAAAFLLLAIILFIVAIFMKDTRDQYQDDLVDEKFENSEAAYEEGSYVDSFDRYPNTADAGVDKDDLKDMIAETTENLGETKMFTPIVDIPLPDMVEEPIEEPVEVEEITEEAEALYESPIEAFDTFADEDADVKIVEEAVAEEAPEDVVEEVPEVAAEEEDDFAELPPPKKPLFTRMAVADEADDVPKPAVKTKGGMSFAEEVRRLIEEEERRNKNS